MTDNTLIQLPKSWKENLEREFNRLHDHLRGIGSQKRIEEAYTEAKEAHQKSWFEDALRKLNIKFALSMSFNGVLSVGMLLSLWW